MQQPDKTQPSRAGAIETEKKKETDAPAAVVPGAESVSATSGTYSRESEKTKKETESLLRKAPGVAVVPGAESVSASSGTTSQASSAIESAEERAKRKARRADAGKSATTEEEEEATTQSSTVKVRHADEDGSSVPPSGTRNNDNQNDDEETMVEAVLAVDHTDEIQAARDENEALRRRVEALESGNQGGAVQQGQNDAAIVVAVADSPAGEENNESDQDEDDDEGDPKRRMVVFGSLIIIVIAIALAVVFGTRSDPVEVVADPTTSPVSIPITSSSPTEALLFEKPTEEECNQVRNGNQVEGQEKMPVRNFDIMVDANMDAGVAVDDQAHWDELESRIQAGMVPILVGCTSSNSRRRLRYLASSRYVVANAVTRHVIPLDDQLCESEHRENGDGVCVPVRVNLDLYLKGLESDTTLQLLLLDYFQGDVLPVLELSPSTPFLSIVVTKINSNSPTEAPSTRPSRVPSVVPTITPSSTPSARPTGTPSSNPTGAPSTVPTISCPDSCAGDNNAGNACCMADSSTIGCGSCLGWWACGGADMEVSRNSCIGEEACIGVSGGVIGENSCNGNNACSSFSGAIGDNSCNGIGACGGDEDGSGAKTLSVGNGSCNCEDCCACLPENAKVPDNSCNTRDGFRDFFSGGKGPYEVCCPSDPSATYPPTAGPTHGPCGYCCCQIQSNVGPCGTQGCSAEVCDDYDCSNFFIYY